MDLGVDFRPFVIVNLEQYCKILICNELFPIYLFGRPSSRSQLVHKNMFAVVVRVRPFTQIDIASSCDSFKFRLWYYLFSHFFLISFLLFLSYFYLFNWSEGSYFYRFNSLPIFDFQGQRFRTICYFIKGNKIYRMYQFSVVFATF